MLRGPNHCSYCLCAPCVVQLPPDFLRGTCAPHATNNEKRHRLYHLFWKLLKDLGVWRDTEYLGRKAQRTTRDDRRDILPQCVIEVNQLDYTCTHHVIGIIRKYDRDILVLMGTTEIICRLLMLL